MLEVCEMARDKPPVITALRGAEPEGEPLVIVVDDCEVLAYQDPSGIRIWSLKRPKRVAPGPVLGYQIEEPSEEIRSRIFHTIRELKNAVRKILSQR
jgi:hypothetical protein